MHSENMLKLFESYLLRLENGWSGFATLLSPHLSKDAFVLAPPSLVISCRQIEVAWKRNSPHANDRHICSICIVEAFLSFGTGVVTLYTPTQHPHRQH